MPFILPEISKYFSQNKKKLLLALQQDTTTGDRVGTAPADVAGINKTRYANFLIKKIARAILPDGDLVMGDESFNFSEEQKKAIIEAVAAQNLDFTKLPAIDLTKLEQELKKELEDLQRKRAESDKILSLKVQFLSALSGRVEKSAALKSLLAEGLDALNNLVEGKLASAKKTYSESISEFLIKVNQMSPLPTNAARLFDKISKSSNPSNPMSQRVLLPEHSEIGDIFLRDGYETFSTQDLSAFLIKDGDAWRLKDGKMEEIDQKYGERSARGGGGGDAELLSTFIATLSEDDKELLAEIKENLGEKQLSEYFKLTVDNKLEFKREKILDLIPMPKDVVAPVADAPTPLAAASPVGAALAPLTLSEDDYKELLIIARKFKALAMRDRDPVTLVDRLKNDGTTKDLISEKKHAWVEKAILDGRITKEIINACFGEDGLRAESNVTEEFKLLLNPLAIGPAPATAAPTPLAAASPVGAALAPLTLSEDDYKELLIIARKFKALAMRERDPDPVTLVDRLKNDGTTKDLISEKKHAWVEKAILDGRITKEIINACFGEDGLRAESNVTEEFKLLLNPLAIGPAPATAAPAPLAAASPVATTPSPVVAVEKAGDFTDPVELMKAFCLIAKEVSADFVGSKSLFASANSANIIYLSKFITSPIYKALFEQSLKYSSLEANKRNDCISIPEDLVTIYKMFSEDYIDIAAKVIKLKTGSTYKSPTIINALAEVEAVVACFTPLQEKIKEKQLSKFCSVVRKIDGIDLSNSSFEVDFFIASSDAEGIGGTLAKLAFGELFKDIFKSGSFFYTVNSAKSKELSDGMAAIIKKTEGILKEVNSATDKESLIDKMQSFNQALKLLVEDFSAKLNNDELNQVPPAGFDVNFKGRAIASLKERIESYIVDKGLIDDRITRPLVTKLKRAAEFIENPNKILEVFQLVTSAALESVAQFSVKDNDLIKHALESYKGKSSKPEILELEELSALDLMSESVKEQVQTNVVLFDAAVDKKDSRYKMKQKELVRVKVKKSDTEKQIEGLKAKVVAVNAQVEVAKKFGNVYDPAAIRLYAGLGLSGDQLPEEVSRTKKGSTEISPQELEARADAKVKKERDESVAKSQQLARDLAALQARFAELERRAAGGVVDPAELAAAKAEASRHKRAAESSAALAAGAEAANKRAAELQAQLHAVVTTPGGADPAVVEGLTRQLEAANLEKAALAEKLVERQGKITELNSIGERLAVMTSQVAAFADAGITNPSELLDRMSVIEAEKLAMEDREGLIADAEAELARRSALISEASDQAGHELSALGRQIDASKDEDGNDLSAEGVAELQIRMEYLLASNQGLELEKNRVEQEKARISRDRKTLEAQKSELAGARSEFVASFGEFDGVAAKAALLDDFKELQIRRYYLSKEVGRLDELEPSKTHSGTLVTESERAFHDLNGRVLEGSEPLTENVLDDRLLKKLNHLASSDKKPGEKISLYGRDFRVKDGDGFIELKFQPNASGALVVSERVKLNEEENLSRVKITSDILCLKGGGQKYWYADIGGIDFDDSRVFSPDDEKVGIGTIDGIDFFGSSIRDCSFTETNDFKAEKASFTRCSLTGITEALAEDKGANFKGVSFNDCIITAVDFSVVSPDIFKTFKIDDKTIFVDCQAPRGFEIGDDGKMSKSKPKSLSSISEKPGSSPAAPFTSKFRGGVYESGFRTTRVH